MEEVPLLSSVDLQGSLRGILFECSSRDDGLRPRRQLLPGQVLHEAAHVGRGPRKQAGRRRAETRADLRRLHEDLHDVRGAREVQLVHAPVSRSRIAATRAGNRDRVHQQELRGNFGDFCRPAPAVRIAQGGFQLRAAESFGANFARSRIYFLPSVGACSSVYRTS